MRQRASFVFVKADITEDIFCTTWRERGGIVLCRLEKEDMADVFS